MEMRVEPKLSYPERLIISGSRGKIWFGYFLFVTANVWNWIKRNVVSGVLKLLCFLTIISLILLVLGGIIKLALWLVPMYIIQYAFFVLLGGLALAAIIGMAKEAFEEILINFKIEKNRVREAAFHKLGQQTPELYTSPQSDYAELQYIKNSLEEVRQHIEEQNKFFLKELENV